MESLFWYDYETFGANPQRDRPSQFAGIRTDLELNVIEDPFTIFCSPSPDFIPNPDACLITGITPQQALREGIVEAEFIASIYEKMSQPGTCNVGYNNIRFDDEVTRNSLYRCFMDPYEHEWKNGNSRWDLIDIVRLTHAVRPDGINWPLNEDGTPSFRLELLTAANGISHESAHDATSDVFATIAMAKLIKEKQPQLYEYAFNHRRKTQVAALFDLNTHKPLFHVSSKIPASRGCSALVAPIVEHPTNKNGIVVLDLRQDPSKLLDMEVEEIRSALYTPTSEMKEGAERPLIKTIHLNKCPVVCPASMIKTIPDSQKEKWQLNLDVMQEHLEIIRRYPEVKTKLREVFNEPHKITHADPDLQIYSGGFFSANDKQQMTRVRKANLEELQSMPFHFEDARLSEMLFRYKARNYPESLLEEEQELWEGFCRDRFYDKEVSHYTVQQFSERFTELMKKPDLNEEQRFILEELACYVESILPYE